MDALLMLARAHGLVVIEDSAQAIGVPLRGGAACLSFFPSKNLGAWGDGGAVVTNERAVADRVRRLRAHGREGTRHVEIGTNSRLDAVQAAVLEVKAKRLPAWARARADARERYDALLAPLAERVRAPARSEHPLHQYVLRVGGGRRDDLAAHLARAGIETRAYYATPLHREPCFAEMDRPTVPEAERVSREMLAIPFFYGITEAQQTRVVDAIAAFAAA
jgi:dTDP-4-amino-4,6-dideoxygalactose transaminase